MNRGVFKEGWLWGAVIQGRTTVGLVRVVLTVVVSVTNIGRVGADPCATLELPRPAFELSYHGEKDKNRCRDRAELGP